MSCEVSITFIISYYSFVFLTCHILWIPIFFYLSHCVNNTIFNKIFSLYPPFENILQLGRNDNKEKEQFDGHFNPQKKKKNTSKILNFLKQYDVWIATNKKKRTEYILLI